MTEQDCYDQYDEMLDEMGTVNAGGYEFEPSRILKELDPIAYSCGFSDWVDSMGIDIEEL